MRAPLLALLGLLIAISPALAARTPQAQQRGKVTAQAHSTASKPSRATPRASATSSSRSRTSATTSRSRSRVAAAPARNTRSSATSTRGRSRGSATAARSSRSGKATASASRRGTRYASATSSTACRGNARNCRLYRVSAPQPMRWSQGLSPALNVQTSNCPAGTMATLATGHTSVIRCMPI